MKEELLELYEEYHEYKKRLQREAPYGVVVNEGSFLDFIYWLKYYSNL